MIHWFTLSVKFALGGGSVCISVDWKGSFHRKCSNDVPKNITFMALFMVCVALSTNENWFWSFLSPPSPSSEPPEAWRLNRGLGYTHKVEHDGLSDKKSSTLPWISKRQSPWTFASYHHPRLHPRPRLEMVYLHEHCSRIEVSQGSKIKSFREAFQARFFKHTHPASDKRAFNHSTVMHSIGLYVVVCMDSKGVWFVSVIGWS